MCITFNPPLDYNPSPHLDTILGTIIKCHFMSQKILRQTTVLFRHIHKLSHVLYCVQERKQQLKTHKGSRPQVYILTIMVLMFCGVFPALLSSLVFVEFTFFLCVFSLCVLGYIFPHVINSFCVSCYFVTHLSSSFWSLHFLPVECFLPVLLLSPHWFVVPVPRYPRPSTVFSWSVSLILCQLVFVYGA